MRLLSLTIIAALAASVAFAQTRGPDFSAVIAPPPAKGSAADKEDRALFKATRKLEGGARWALATQDANLSMPQAADNAFSCALGAPINAADTPKLSALMLRTLIIAGGATGAPKKLYQRARPFTVYRHAHICAPLRDIKSPSYPSGHAAAGWGWALVLAEVAPERAPEILARGRAFGESRIVCGVHWRSDVAAGREIGAGAIAAAHADPQFRAEIEAAKAELAEVRARGLTPAADCKAEAAALATPIPQ
jgi:acid phosphatase (class A)